MAAFFTRCVCKAKHPKKMLCPDGSMGNVVASTCSCGRVVYPMLTREEWQEQQQLKRKMLHG